MYSRITFDLLDVLVLFYKKARHKADREVNHSQVFGKSSSHIFVKIILLKVHIVKFLNVTLVFRDGTFILEKWRNVSLALITCYDILV